MKVIKMPDVVYKKGSLRVVKFRDLEKGECVQIWVRGQAAPLTLAQFREMVNAVDNTMPKKYAACPQCGDQHMTYDATCDPIFYCSKCDKTFEAAEVAYVASPCPCPLCNK